MGTELTLAIIQAILLNGPRVVMDIAARFEGGNVPTPEEIRALKIDKDPEDYFNNG